MRGEPPAGDPCAAPVLLSVGETEWRAYDAWPPTPPPSTVREAMRRARALQGEGRFATLRRVAGGRHRVASGGGDAGPDRRTWPSRWSPQRVALVLVIVAALAIVPFGGWSAAVDGPTGPLPRQALDEVSEGLPWNVTITGGRLLDDQPPLLRATTPGNRWVIILATVEVTADTSRSDTADILRISGAEGLVTEAPDTVAIVSDLTTHPYLHPGLPESVLFAWEQSASAPVPTEVEVTIFSKTFRPDTLSGMRQWLDWTPRAVVRVPIVDRRGL